VSKGERGDSRFRGNDNAIQNCFHGKAKFQRRKILSFWSVAIESICILMTVFLMACDFHGPWEYYPEERDVYTGIYTYGYIVAGEGPNVCFSKVYGLEESSAENFAFYDSAFVTVTGRFARYNSDEKEEATVFLSPEKTANCFSGGMLKGIEGESYTMEATFRWDSAGHEVTSTYKAQATIPKPLKIKGLNIPKRDGSFEWVEYDMWSDKAVEMDFLEYPMDMEFVRLALDYDNSVRGVLSIMDYGNAKGEAMNTTVNKMFEGVTTKDDDGYQGIAMHDPLESQQNFGYSMNYTIGGVKNLDTLYLTNMMLPVGEISVDLYATDDAYIDYVDKVKQSVMDSRVVPKSNIENGMGVFSGMAKTTLRMNVENDNWASSWHIAARNCLNEKDDNKNGWNSKGCRLFMDVYCAGKSPLTDLESDLVSANENAYSYYGLLDGNYRKNDETCFPSNVKAAMMQEKNGWKVERWSVYLPDTISAEQKSIAYADGLKRYCVASNFKNNKLADCSNIRARSLDSLSINESNTYLWQWCADRNWNYNRYPQCGPAMVNRYVVEHLNSSIWEKEIKKWCENPCNEEYAVCKDLGYKHESGKVCIEPITLVTGGTHVVY